MRKFIKIIGFFLGIIILFVVAVQFFGFTIGNIQIGKSKNTISTKQTNTLDQSIFAEKYLNSDGLTCVNVWATWCKPCIEEMPELNTVMKEYFDKNVNFVSISADSDSIKLQRFLDSKKFNFVDITFPDITYRKAIFNYLEGKPLDYNENNQILPVTYLIKNRKVIKKIVGGTDRAELINLINKNL